MLVVILFFLASLLSLLLVNLILRSRRVPYPQLSKLPPQRDDIITFFYQGNAASRFQASQYSGGHPVRSEGHPDPGAFHPDAPLLLHNIYEHPEIPEISFTFTLNPFSLFVTLLTTLQNQHFGRKNAQGHHFNISRASVGGELDVSHHQIYLRRLLAENRGRATRKKIVLFGPSRGGATTLVSVANLLPHEIQEISLVIVEAPFDTLPNVIRQSSRSSKGIMKFRPILDSFLLKFAPYISSIDLNQESPLQAIEKLPLDFPLAFILSKADCRVPPQCTQTLIDRLRERGHRELNVLVLETSPHPTMSIDNKADVLRYTEFINRLYDRYL